MEFTPTCNYRKNYSAPMYCDIAMEAYYDAYLMLKALKDAELNTDDAVGKPNSEFFHLYPVRIQKKIATSIIFTELAAEAFINDYLSAYFGDVIFSKTYSGLTIYNKLNAISTDIFHLGFNFTFEWFPAFRDMVERRNSFVHSVSTGISVDEFTELFHGKDKEAYAAAIQRVEAVRRIDPYNLDDQYIAALSTEEYCESYIEYKNEHPRYMYITNPQRKHLENEISEAQKSLQALCDMTRDFEKRDPQSYAFRLVFSPGSLLLGEDDERAIRKVVFPDLGLPIKNDIVVEKPGKTSKKKEASAKENTKKGKNKNKHKNKG